MRLDPQVRRGTQGANAYVINVGHNKVDAGPMQQCLIARHANPDPSTAQCIYFQIVSNRNETRTRVYKRRFSPFPCDGCKGSTTGIVLTLVTVTKLHLKGAQPTGSAKRHR